MPYKPPYIRLHEEGNLAERAEALWAIMKHCTICPHHCGVDRTAGEKGKCRSGVMPVVSAVQRHMGEEACLVGRNGSGTIFFTNCNLACIFCQNYDISHEGRGGEMSFDELADAMLSLQDRGCHNINLVTPTHMVYGIVMALRKAVPKGLHLPIVYNSGGYDSVETLELLDGIVDIYMPDFKYMDPDAALELSGAEDYPSAAMAALKEMHRQVGDLKCDAEGIACRGLLVRHLVLPNNRASSDRVIAFLAELSKDTYVNIMDQYRLEYRARECFDLRRRVTLDEYASAIRNAECAGLHRIDGHRRKCF
jgi:putative pyruvate formate lyase activating enzyme